jgi:putative polymerase
MARNAAVIGIFLMLGLRVDERTVISTFVISAIAVAAVLLLESVAVTSYAALFEPGRYFEETRGISRFELDEIGLFANALGFDDRFAILSLIAHRTSSLFLEQVSLANFATVLTVFLVAMWPRLRLPVRVFFPLLIAAILVTNNSRTALAIALAGPIVYLLAPKLPQLIILGLLPLILAMALVVSQTAPPSTEDDLVGRLSLTIRTLYELDLPGLLGAEALIANDFLDSGYTFVIYASSVLGLIVLWLFYSLVPAGRDAALKRAGLMTGLYLFINLTVSGTSIFSIKTAALLWFLIGFLRHEAEEQEGASPSSVGQELRSAHKPRDAFG